MQEEIGHLLANRNRFVMGIAIEEIEAWWLADRKNTLLWSGFQHDLPGDCRYAVMNYCAEDDDNPKKTLDELTRVSGEFDRYYGEGSVELAQDFVDEYWREFAQLNAIQRDCDRGYAPFERRVTQQFRRVRGRAGRLF